MAVIEMQNEYKLVLLNNVDNENIDKALLVESEELQTTIAKYKTGFYDFGEPYSKKVVRKVLGRVKSEKGVNVKIFNDAGESVCVELSNNNEMLPVVLDGKAIGFEILADNGVAEVESLQLEVF